MGFLDKLWKDVKKQKHFTTKRKKVVVKKLTKKEKEKRIEKIMKGHFIIRDNDKILEFKNYEYTSKF